MWQAMAGGIRYKKIWLDDGVLKAGDASGTLWPLQKPELPTEFQRVEDVLSAIKFERRYSPLGYDLLVKDPEARRGGDPLQWVLDQAKFVRITLNLLCALDAGDGNDALRQYRHCEIEGINDSHPALHGKVALTYPCGAYNCEMIIPVPKSETDALSSIPGFIAMLVNANTEDVRQKLEVQHSGNLIWIIFFRALIEAIWSMVGDLAIKTQQGQRSGYLKKCEWCELPFLVSDKRQKFCPRPSWAGPGQSFCSLKYHQHKLKSKQNISQKILPPAGVSEG